MIQFISKRRLIAPLPIGQCKMGLSDWSIIAGYLRHHMSSHGTFSIASHNMSNISFRVACDVRTQAMSEIRALEMASSTVAAATIRAVKGRKILPTRAALTLTPNAVNKIKDILKDKNEYIGLKVGVRQRGCNGLSYTMEYAKEKSKLDEEVIQDGVHIFIDRKAQLSLLGTEMDYIENKLSSEFVFNNPNIKGTCGCGESFSV